MKTQFAILYALTIFSGFTAMGETKTPALAQMCFACHGAEGFSQNDLWPNIAGQKNGYLLKQMTAFKSGERKDPLMSPIASNLSEEEIQQLAKYFSQVKSPGSTN